MTRKIWLTTSVLDKFRTRVTSCAYIYMYTLRHLPMCRDNSMQLFRSFFATSTCWCIKHSSLRCHSYLLPTSWCDNFKPTNLLYIISNSSRNLIDCNFRLPHSVANPPEINYYWLFLFLIQFNNKPLYWLFFPTHCPNKWSIDKTKQTRVCPQSSRYLYSLSNITLS